MDVDSGIGLTTEQVEARRAEGLANIVPPRTGKTLRQIVAHNVFTRINLILGVLFAMVLVTGSLINGAFGLLIIANSGIGIIQEVRAKRTLESLSVIGEERPRVYRDSALIDLAQDEIVLDDVIALASGNQIVVDGVVTESHYLSIDESLLTGESDPVEKKPGDEVLSGSFVVSGTGTYRVTTVGAESYAAKLAAEASKFTLAHSHLQAGINTILGYITWILIPVGILTVIGQTRVGMTDWREIILSITGALVPMVPEGLILITSTAFALGIIRLGRRQCLVQELPAIEGLARVDVVCADKTGTLTENALIFDHVESLVDGAEEGLVQLLHADRDHNATAAAIAAAYPAPDTPWEVTDHQPFTSARKWSGTRFTGHGSWVLGAPDVLAPDTAAAQRATELGAEGLRVLLLCHGESELGAPGKEPAALIILTQKVRDDAKQTLEYFGSQGVRVSIISGDNPASVGAVTTSLGVDGGEPVDARELTEETFDEAVRTGRVFGRVTPNQKKDMVTSLQSAGHTVAMTGDGVNDVLALKEADLGVAMGSGSAAARAVAKIVLVDNRFATLPHVVAEGRRVIDNIERVAKLFLTKTIYSSLMALLVLVTAIPFPFLPIHVTITGWFTIGIPAFILALPPSNKRAETGFVRRVMRFSVPAGIIVGLSSFVTYLWASNWHVPRDHDLQSSAALLALIIASSWVLAVVARPWRWWKIALITMPIIGYGIIFTWPVTVDMFTLPSDPAMMIKAAICGLVGAAGVELTWWLTLRTRVWDRLTPVPHTN